MSAAYEGVCQGGPWAGQSFASPNARVEIFENRYIEGARRTGEYVYSSAGGGCWIWEPDE